MGNINVSKERREGWKIKEDINATDPDWLALGFQRAAPPRWTVTIIYLFESSVSSRRTMYKCRAFLLPTRLFRSTWDRADSISSASPRFVVCCSSPQTIIFVFGLSVNSLGVGKRILSFFDCSTVLKTKTKQLWKSARRDVTKGTDKSHMRVTTPGGQVSTCLVFVPFQKQKKPWKPSTGIRGRNIKIWKNRAIHRHWVLL